MRPVLIGMNNPLSPRPEHALWPSPPGCTGHRLWKMLSARTGATEDEYVECFERVNLVQERRWDQMQAVVNASLIRPTLRGRTVVLLGQSVRRAFNVPGKLLHPQEIDGVTWRQLPHPSGRCHWYNDKKNREVAGLLLEELFQQWRSGREGDHSGGTAVGAVGAHDLHDGAGG